MPEHEDKELLSQIFDMVQSKKDDKPAKKKRVQTPEQRAQSLANLARGREKSMANRKAKAEAKRLVPSKPIMIPVSKPVVQAVPLPIQTVPVKDEPVREPPPNDLSHHHQNDLSHHHHHHQSQNQSQNLFRS